MIKSKLIQGTKGFIMLSLDLVGLIRYWIDSRNTSVVIPSTPVVRYDKLQPDEVKEVLLCLLYVLRHADEEALMAWWHNASQHDLICFFHILE